MCDYSTNILCNLKYDTRLTRIMKATSMLLLLVVNESPSKENLSIVEKHGT